MNRKTKIQIKWGTILYGISAIIFMPFVLFFSILSTASEAILKSWLGYRRWLSVKFDKVTFKRTRKIKKHE